MKRIMNVIYGNRTEKYNVEVYGIQEDGKADICVWNMWSEYRHKLKIYYREERTWDDHMGNTPCGYYVNLPLPNGEKRRCYLYS